MLQQFGNLLLCQFAKKILFKLSDWPTATIPASCKLSKGQEVPAESPGGMTQLTGNSLHPCPPRCARGFQCPKPILRNKDWIFFLFFFPAGLHVTNNIT